MNYDREEDITSIGRKFNGSLEEFQRKTHTIPRKIHRNQNFNMMSSAFLEMMTMR